MKHKTKNRSTALPKKNDRSKSREINHNQAFQIPWTRSRFDLYKESGEFVHNDVKIHEIPASSVSPLSLMAASLVCSFRRLRGSSRKTRRKERDLERVDVLVPSLASQEDSRRAVRDSLNLAFTNQRSAANERQGRGCENDRGGNWMREADREMREAGQFRSLSFRVFALRGSQPGKKKRLTRCGAVGEESDGTRGVKGRRGTRAKFERAERREIRTEEQGSRNGAWIFRFPASHWFTSCLGVGRKKRRKRSSRGKTERPREWERAGGSTISAVCMRGRRQTLLNCPMTPYIPFYWCALLHPLTIPPRRVVIPILKKTDPTPCLKAPHVGNNTLRAFELR